ncbi:hypothetical protein C1I93_03715 [Micromonospora endophytica]|uniref:Uncharacterized protein n=1 Tax=Micromonospora endophytica TaxID=515350 RepID=A0A2W2D890_9ACTN|nr:hypothetical protein [Micromonospora endophytica]PZG00049.1 hypothetical protein C1I93_03715 [Micromonospora endophytica]RIW47075.1 hypothetical protein D3H59_10820 [Micromonospora endophytica]BCJ61014.1 hypothetical protein Jiend_44360 [Micromonospora endophytica]
MKQSILSAVQAGKEPSAKEILSEMESSLGAVTANAGDSEVAAALKKFQAENAKAAAASDPEAAGEAPAYEKAAADATAACKKVGVNY